MGFTNPVYVVFHTPSAPLAGPKARKCKPVGGVAMLLLLVSFGWFALFSGGCAPGNVRPSEHAKRATGLPDLDLGHGWFLSARHPEMSVIRYCSGDSPVRSLYFEILGTDEPPRWPDHQRVGVHHSANNRYAVLLADNTWEEFPSGNCEDLFVKSEAEVVESAADHIMAGLREASGKSDHPKGLLHQIDDYVKAALPQINKTPAGPQGRSLALNSEPSAAYVFWDAGDVAFLRCSATALDVVPPVKGWNLVVVTSSDCVGGADIYVGTGRVDPRHMARVGLVVGHAMSRKLGSGGESNPGHHLAVLFGTKTAASNGRTQPGARLPRDRWLQPYGHTLMAVGYSIVERNLNYLTVNPYQWQPRAYRVSGETTSEGASYWTFPRPDAPMGVHDLGGGVVEPGKDGKPSTYWGTLVGYRGKNGRPSVKAATVRANREFLECAFKRALNTPANQGAKRVSDFESCGHEPKGQPDDHSLLGFGEHVLEVTNWEPGHCWVDANTTRHIKRRNIYEVEQSSETRLRLSWSLTVESNMATGEEPGAPVVVGMVGPVVAPHEMACPSTFGACECHPEQPGVPIDLTCKCRQDGATNLINNAVHRIQFDLGVENPTHNDLENLRRALVDS